MNIERELLRDKLPRERLLSSVKKPLCKRNKRRGREKLSRLEIQNKLKVKQSNFIPRLRNFRDKSFL